MKRSLVAIAVAAMVVGFAATGSASTIWYLDDVTFIRNGDPGIGTAIGQFEVNDNNLELDSWDITVSGFQTLALGANHHYLKGAPNETYLNFSSSGVWFANWSVNPNPYLILYFSSPLTGAGPIALTTDSLACDGCGVLTTGSITRTPLDAPTPVPEPASLTLLGLGMAGFAARKLRARKP